MKRGLIHVYTGSGKGKTTAAFGLALRACGSGLKVCVFQFLKGQGRASSELEGARKLCRNLEVVRFKQVYPLLATLPSTSLGMVRGMVSLSNHYSLLAAYKDLKRQIEEDLRAVKRVLLNREYDLIILDEILCCVANRFISEKAVLEIIVLKPAGTELVLTGRGATKKIIDRADYVTEMKEVKHPYKRGIKARRGIEC